MIRVAYGAPVPHGGGALNYLVDLVEHHDTTKVHAVVYLDDHIGDADSAIARLTRCGVDVRRGPMAAPMDQFLRAGWWERELRARGPFDVANLHQHIPGAGRAFLEGARRAGAGILVRTEQLPRFPPHERATWRPRPLALRFARSRLAAITDRRIVVSDAGRRALAARGEPEATISVIPPAFCEEAFASLPSRADAKSRLGIAGDAIVVGFLASLSEQKRPDLFLDAAERLVAEGLRAVFVIGGGGPWAAQIRARAATLKPHVIDIGPRNDAAAVLAAFDVFVLPSLWEGMPLTVLEAMRAGVAVVASDADGTGEVVRDGETGRLVAKGDGTALTTAIRDLLTDASTRRRLAAAGMAFVRGRFDAATLARRTEALYESMTRQPPSARR
ncbi:MAG: glycosyltransferase family 4 protein [Planctomycetes bacterium]|nr:glycosyltransferase family 4 protein [Planctomycetota bacterium]